MIAWVVILVLGATAALLLAGYLFGVHRGRTARRGLQHTSSELQTEVERLGAQLLKLEQEATLLRETSAGAEFDASEILTSVEASMARYEAGLQAMVSQSVGTLANKLNTQGQHDQSSGDEIKAQLAALEAKLTDSSAIRAELERAVAPMRRQNREDADFRRSMLELLGPLADRQRVGDRLAHLDSDVVDRSRLPQLLDAISQHADLAVCLISDEEGLLLGSGTSDLDVETVAGVSALVFHLRDRIAQSGQPAPTTVVFHDASNRYVLHRIFAVRDQRFLLTAISVEKPMAHTMFDPALRRIEALLEREAWHQG